jgi:hypothetical protein
MNRRDHHCSPIAPRLLTALIPPSTRIGLAGGQLSQDPVIRVLHFLRSSPGLLGSVIKIAARRTGD